jgi:phosphoribosylanthranilate isomerase
VTAKFDARTSAGRRTDQGSSLGYGLVKIDGLREPEHAAAAARSGADLVGFIFAPARRRVTPVAARLAIAAAREATPDYQVMAVGVFVDAGATEINRVVHEAGLDLVQLHGDEPPELLQEIACRVLKAVRPPLGTAPSEVAGWFERFSAVPNAPLLYILDGYTPHAAGGAGVRSDWALASILAGDWPLCLAGGLEPANVSEAIRSVRPVAVDVSSGVETAGVKDSAKIEAFIRAAKRAFGELATPES